MTRGVNVEAVLGLLDPAGEAISHREHLDDMIAAWLHAADHSDHELIGHSVEGFSSVLQSTGRIPQGLELLEQAISRIDGKDDGTWSALAGLRVAESVFLQREGHYHAAVDAVEAAVEAATKADDRGQLVRAMVSLAWARKWTVGHFAQKDTLLEALPIAESLDDELLQLQSAPSDSPPIGPIADNPRTIDFILAWALRAGVAGAGSNLDGSDWLRAAAALFVHLKDRPQVLEHECERFRTNSDPGLDR